MRGFKAPDVKLTQKQSDILKKILKYQSLPNCLVKNKIAVLQVAKRANIILQAAEGISNCQIARNLSLNNNTVNSWRRQWVELSEQLFLDELECDDDRIYINLIIGILSGEQRSGRNPSFSSEQINKIVALSYEDPKDSGRLISRWTTPQLADEAVKRGIVEKISPASVGIFLKSHFRSLEDTLIYQYGN